jgi:uncharacterized membrane protein
MLAALGNYTGALGALQLLAVNLISINLAGILTFLAMGFRPGSREEVTKARVLISLALMVWIAGLITITLLILSH